MTPLRAEAASQEGWAKHSVEKAYARLTQPFIREMRWGIEQGLIRPVDPEL